MACVSLGIPHTRGGRCEAALFSSGAFAGFGMRSGAAPDHLSSTAGRPPKEALVDVHHPREAAEESTAPLAVRRREYVEWILQRFGEMEPEMAPGDGRRWALNHARLLWRRDLDAAGRYFAAFALTRDADICFIRALKTLLDFRGAGFLSREAEGHLLGLLAAWPRNDLSSMARWPAIHTENHDLMHLTIGLFQRLALGEAIGDQERQIRRSLAWRLERGWVEWNSPCYQFHYSNPLMVLVDHAPTDALRRGAEAVLNLMLAERAVLGVQGYLGGPAFRCRTADANDSPTARKVAYLEDNRYDGFLPTVWLAFGLGEPRFDFATARVSGLEPATDAYASANEPRLKQDEGTFFACSAFQPHPVVLALAEEGRTRPSLTYRGQRYLGWPEDPLWATQRWLPGDVCCYNTPHVSMASVHSAGWVCQSRYSNVMFAADPSCNLRLETLLPGVPPTKRRNEARGYVVQHKSWMLGRGSLFEDGGLRPRTVGAWNVYRVGKGLCAHLNLPEETHVLQVSDLDTHSSEEAFVAALDIPRWEGSRVSSMVGGDRVDVGLEEMSIAVNGVPRAHPPEMLHDCECLRSVYGSGVVTLATAAGSLTLDRRDFYEGD